MDYNNSSDCDLKTVDLKCNMDYNNSSDCDLKTVNFKCNMDSKTVIQM